MPKHIVRLLVLLVVLAVLFAAGKRFLPPHSFWAYGHYRAASVEEIASATPKIRDATSYAKVFPKEYAVWSDGIHKVVQCQVCHMAQAIGPIPTTASAARVAQAAAGIPMPYDSLKLCVECHQRIAGRPATQPQIVVSTHAQGKQCTACHNPHSPLTSPSGGPIVLASVPGGAADVGAGKAKAAAVCAACHGASGISTLGTFPNLACQKNEYLSGALTAFQSGGRNNPIMSPVAKGLSAADIRNLAAYFSGLSCRT